MRLLVARAAAQVELVSTDLAGSGAGRDASTYAMAISANGTTTIRTAADRQKTPATVRRNCFIRGVLGRGCTPRQAAIDRALEGFKGFQRGRIAERQQLREEDAGGARGRIGPIVLQLAMPPSGAAARPFGPRFGLIKEAESPAFHLARERIETGAERGVDAGQHGLLSGAPTPSRSSERGSGLQDGGFGQDRLEEISGSRALWT